MNVAIVDYGIGNLGSIIKAFRHVGVDPVLTGDHAELDAADVLVLPGDGAFAWSIAELERRGLVSLLKRAAASGKTLIGICIGMQLLFEESEEHGRYAGLALLPGRVRRFEGDLPVPHMGWNALKRTRQHPVLDSVRPGDRVYFIHSYYCDADPDVVLATCDYGVDFAAVVARDNILGFQFHPEKSQRVGLGMVESLVRFCRGRVASVAEVQT
jgi:glutamine amidotransferase